MVKELNGLDLFIQRYDIDIENNNPIMRKSETGDWVSYEDWMKLLKRRLAGLVYESMLNPPKAEGATFENARVGDRVYWRRRGVSGTILGVGKTSHPIMVKFDDGSGSVFTRKGQILSEGPQEIFREEKGDEEKLV